MFTGEEVLFLEDFAIGERKLVWLCVFGQPLPIVHRPGHSSKIVGLLYIYIYISMSVLWVWLSGY